MAIAPALTWRATSPSSGSQPVLRRIDGSRRRSGAAGRGAVIKGRYPEALPDPCARPVSESCGLFQARSAQWNERKHVERAHPRMEAAVPAKVDPLERDAGKFDRGIEHLRCVTDDR